MRVIITGGCGFLGQCLARELLKRGSLKSSVAAGGASKLTGIVLADISRPDAFVVAGLADDPRVTVRLGDVADRAFVESLFASGGEDGEVSVFHLSAVMSGQGEEDFDLCVGVNLMGMLHVLEVGGWSQCDHPRERGERGPAA